MKHFTILLILLLLPICAFGQDSLNVSTLGYLFESFRDPIGVDSWGDEVVIASASAGLIQVRNVDGELEVVGYVSHDPIEGFASNKDGRVATFHGTTVTVFEWVELEPGVHQLQFLLEFESIPEDYLIAMSYAGSLVSITSYWSYGTYSMRHFEIFHIRENGEVEIFREIEDPNSSSYIASSFNQNVLIVQERDYVVLYEAENDSIRHINSLRIRYTRVTHYQNDHVYLFMENSIRWFDLSDRNNPVEQEVIVINRDVDYGGFLVDDTLKVVLSEGDVKWLASYIFTPEPVLVSEIEFEETPDFVSVTGRNVYGFSALQDQNCELSYFEVDAGNQRYQAADELFFDDAVFSIAFTDEYGYAARGENGISIVTPHPDELPEIRGYYEIPASNLLVADSLLLATHGNTLSIYSLSDPLLPELRSSLNIPENTSPALWGDNKVLLDDRFIDFTETENPVISDPIDLEYQHIAGKYPYIYVFWWLWLRTYDCSDFENPELVDEIELYFDFDRPTVRDMKIRPPYLIISGWFDQIHDTFYYSDIIDLHRARNPEVIDGGRQLSAFDAYQQSTFQGYADSLIIVDRSVGDGELVGRYPLAVQPKGLKYFPVTDQLFVIQNNGLQVLDVGEAVGVEEHSIDSKALPHEISLSVSPNPFNNNARIKFNLPARAPAELKLFDLLGREVWSNTITHSLQGEILLSGGDLAAGLYFLRLEQGEYLKTVKTILLK
ncbi:T9SS type A sorting domain-containing protein [bacterium]|nr:T9SS type A sorting domain-containing protein [bacterium]